MHPDSVYIDEIVCDSNFKHQTVVWKQGKWVGMEDGSIQHVDDLDVENHPYLHLDSLVSV